MRKKNEFVLEFIDKLNMLLEVETQQFAKKPQDAGSKN